MNILNISIVRIFPQSMTRRFTSALTHSDNKRIYGLLHSPKSPSATSDTRQSLGEIAGDGLKEEII